MRNLFHSFLVVGLVVVLGVGSAPIPLLAEDFKAERSTYKQPPPQTFNVVMYRSYSTGKYREESPNNIAIWRYDLGRFYDITNPNDSRNRHCSAIAIPREMPSLWGWMNNSTQRGTCTLRGHNGGLWVASMRFGQRNEVCVMENNVPLAMDQYGSGGALLSHDEFQSFLAETPDKSLYDPPHDCPP